MEFEKIARTKIANIIKNIGILVKYSDLNSQRKLSLIIGENERYIARVTNEERELTLSVALKISMLFDLSLDLLCKDTNEFVNHFKIDKLHLNNEELNKLREKAKDAWATYQAEQ